MKKREILQYIIVLSSFLLSINAYGQSKNETNEFVPLTKEQYKQLPLFQGINVGFDIWGIGSKIFGSDFLSNDFFVEVNLKNRFFPIAEFGIGSTNTTNVETEIHYKASSPYFKIGMNYNILYKKPYLPGYLYCGFRIGHSSFSYDVDAPNIKNPILGNTSIPFEYDGVKSNATWGELLLGINTKIYKRFSMGWALRYKATINVKKSENTQPWFLPGYGKNKSTSLGLTYNLIYKLPF